MSSRPFTVCVSGARVLALVLFACSAILAEQVDSQSAPQDDSAVAAETEAEALDNSTSIENIGNDFSSWLQPSNLAVNLKFVVMMAALSLAPGMFLMTTSYVRIAVVLSILRLGLGHSQIPSNQVTTTLAFFLTALIMTPVWNRIHEEAVGPYIEADGAMTTSELWEKGIIPVREFMSRQIDAAGNGGDVHLFLRYIKQGPSQVATYGDVPIQALLPAYLISELKVAFFIGFRILLPFLVVDIVVSSLTMSAGMMMVPPSTISLPLKLMLFVMVDGWHLVVEVLLQSFRI